MAGINSSYINKRDAMYSKAENFYNNIYAYQGNEQWYCLSNANGVTIYIRPVSKSSVVSGSTIVDMSLTGIMIKFTNGNNRKLEISLMGTVSSLLSSTTSDPKDDYVVNEATLPEVNNFVNTKLTEAYS